MNFFRRKSFQRPLSAPSPYLSYVKILFSQSSWILDTSTVDVIVKEYENILLHVVDIFPHGQWRLIALLHFTSYLLLLLSTPALILRWVVWQCYGIVRSVPQYQYGLQQLCIPVNLLDINTSNYFSDRMCRWVVKPFSVLTWSLWAFNAPTDTFEKIYVQAWQEHYAYNRYQDVRMVSIFVDNEAVRVPMRSVTMPDAEREEEMRNMAPLPYPAKPHIHPGARPGLIKHVTDRETCQALLMWYSWLRVKKGFGEILLPERLVRIDKVRLHGGDLSLGRRVRMLEFGRNAESSVEYFRNPLKIPEGQTYLTRQLFDSSAPEGLEFIRAWDTFTISLIALIPLVVSLASAGIWIGVSMRDHHVDAQIAAQTGFTIASYIITAGALVIALFAFLDSSSQRITDSTETEGDTQWNIRPQPVGLTR